MTDEKTFAVWDTAAAEKECSDCGKLWPSGHKVVVDGGERFWCYMNRADAAAVVSASPGWPFRLVAAGYRRGR